MAGLLPIAARCQEDRVRNSHPAGSRGQPWPARAMCAVRAARSEVFQANLSAFTAVWNYMAVVGLVLWVLFYLL